MFTWTFINKIISGLVYLADIWEFRRIFQNLLLRHCVTGPKVKIPRLFKVGIPLLAPSEEIQLFRFSDLIALLGVFSTSICVKSTILPIFIGNLHSSVLPCIHCGFKVSNICTYRLVCYKNICLFTFADCFLVYLSQLPKVSEKRLTCTFLA